MLPLRKAKTHSRHRGEHEDSRNLSKLQLLMLQGDGQLQQMCEANCHPRQNWKQSQWPRCPWAPAARASAGSRWRPWPAPSSSRSPPGPCRAVVGLEAAGGFGGHAEGRGNHPHHEGEGRADLSKNNAHNCGRKRCATGEGRQKSN